MKLNHLFLTVLMAGLLLVIGCSAGEDDGTTDVRQDVSAADSIDDESLSDRELDESDSVSDPEEDVELTDVPAEELGEDIPDEVTIRPELWTVGEVIDTCGNGLLARYEAEYGDVLVARLQGDHDEMGYQYGCLLGQYIVDMWWTFMESTAEQLEEFSTASEVDAALGLALDIAYSHFSPYIPQVFKDEFAAASRGAADRGVDCHCGADQGVGQIMQRMLTILEVSQTNSFSNGIGAFLEFMAAGGSPEFFQYYQTNEKSAELTGEPADGAHPDREWGVMNTCSYFAIWGDRTVGGHMIASRVLDWSSGMGVADYALVTVYVPDDGYPYALVGYAGCPMAGLSENGIAVGMVGSANVIERINSASGLIKVREGLEFSTDLEDADKLFSNTMDDGLNRPNSIGANALVVWGDPAGGGVQSQAIALELNGALTAAFIREPYPGCGESAAVWEFGLDGRLANVYTHEDHPNRVNLEADAYEIDRDGNLRTFAVNGEGEFIQLDGHFVEDPEGQPMPTGRPLDCAVFRGDEAMAYAVRRWQTAANGPWRGDGSGLMVNSGTYLHRYMVMHDMIEAYAMGTSYMYDDREVIPDNEGEQVLIGLSEGARIASEAAMDSNILSVVYDATALEMYVAFESGRGEDWVPASANPYTHFVLSEMIHPW